jgi:hypothetical protein
VHNFESGNLALFLWFVYCAANNLGELRNRALVLSLPLICMKMDPWTMVNLNWLIFLEFTLDLSTSVWSPLAAPLNLLASDLVRRPVFILPTNYEPQSLGLRLCLKGRLSFVETILYRLACYLVQRNRIRLSCFRGNLMARRGRESCHALPP